LPFVFLLVVALVAPLCLGGWRAAKDKDHKQVAAMSARFFVWCWCSSAPMLLRRLAFHDYIRALPPAGQRQQETVDYSGQQINSLYNSYDAAAG
jgi:hypothetical protein